MMCRPRSVVGKAHPTKRRKWHAEWVALKVDALSLVRKCGLKAAFWLTKKAIRA
jgi:hypothetical protein